MSDKEEDDELYDPVNERSTHHIPKEDSVTLKHGQKIITSTSIEPSGNRMFSASANSTLSLWDFNGMNSQAASFKTVEPCETVQELKKVHFSSTGEHVVVINNDIQCYILDREGENVLETIKGNPYIFDARSNKGHSKPLNYACWNPRVASELLSCASDSSIRIWDILNNEKILQERRIKSHKICIVPKSDRGQKVIPQSCAYSTSGNHIVAGCLDGSIQVWDARKKGVNVDMVCRAAHPPHTAISCVKYSYDDTLIFSRGNDDTMRVFDVRNGMKAPLKVINDLYVTNDYTNLAISPNDQVIITGTSLKKGEDTSYVIAYSRNNFEEIYRFPVEKASAVSVEWHPKLDQILIGDSVGNMYLYFDQQFSRQGALLFSQKIPSIKKLRARREFYQNDVLLTYDDDTERLARLGQRASKFYEGPEISAFNVTKKDAKKRAPELPTDANYKLPTLHQHMVQNVVIPQNRSAEAEYYESHPREAILRHAGKATYWTANAYDKTQPNTIFDEEEDDEDVKPNVSNKKLKM